MSPTPRQEGHATGLAGAPTPSRAWRPRPRVDRHPCATGHPRRGARRTARGAAPPAHRAGVARWGRRPASGPAAPPAGPPGLACGLTAPRLPRPRWTTARPPPRRAPPAAGRSGLRAPAGTNTTPTPLDGGEHAAGGADGLPYPICDGGGVLRGDTTPTNARLPWAWCVRPLRGPTGRAPRVAAATSCPHEVPTAVAGVWPGTPSGAPTPARYARRSGHRPPPASPRIAHRGTYRLTVPPACLLGFSPGASP